MEFDAVTILYLFRKYRCHSEFQKFCDVTTFQNYYIFITFSKMIYFWIDFVQMTLNIEEMKRDLIIDIEEMKSVNKWFSFADPLTSSEKMRKGIYRVFQRYFEKGGFRDYTVKKDQLVNLVMNSIVVYHKNEPVFIVQDMKEYLYSHADNKGKPLKRTINELYIFFRCSH